MNQRIESRGFVTHKTDSFMAFDGAPCRQHPFDCNHAITHKGKTNMLASKTSKTVNVITLELSEREARIVQAALFVAITTEISNQKINHEASQYRGVTPIDGEPVDVCGRVVDAIALASGTADLK